MNVLYQFDFKKIFNFSLNHSYSYLIYLYRDRLSHFTIIISLITYTKKLIDVHSLLLKYSIILYVEN